MKPRLLSPNMLKTFNDCEKKFYLKYIKNVSIPQSAEFFEKGKKIHALASFYLKGQNIDKLENALDKKELEIWKSLKNSKYFDLKVVNCEYTLSVNIEGQWFGGRIDALMKSNSDYVILDYKTGEPPKNPENDFQTLVYMEAVKAKFADLKSLKFVYIDLKNNKNVVIDYDEKKIDIIKNISKRINLAIDSAVYKKTCKHCEYEKICEVIS